MPELGYLDKVLRHAEERLVLKAGARPAEILNVYKKFLKVEEHRLRMLHRAGAGGREIAQGRAHVMDVVLRHVFQAADENYRHTHSDGTVPVSLVAIGGYGRGELSPYSDIDIMFLHDSPARASSHHPYLKEMVEQLLYMLWDVGLKVGHSTRSVSEAVSQANKDMQSKTSMIEARLLIGNEEIYKTFDRALIKGCVKGHEDEYIAARMEDQHDRHEKFGDTVYLQEPNVKAGCGGLRDFQNLIWMAFFKHGTRKLSELRQLGFVEPTEQRQLDAAYDFILRVRNSMHYMTNRSCDVIGLGLQPQIATEFGYRHHDLLRRTEAFMRDYYTHSRNIFLLTNSLADRMALNPTTPSRFSSLLRRARKAEEIDGFLLRDGLISASAPTIFKQDPQRLMRVFHYVQQRDVDLSPELRSQIRHNLKLVDRSFQYSETVRDVFFGILQHKGQVARILRQMHEVEFLGKYIPEFGRLTCLVQHEFFHRYTADEHTLQVIENLDRIIDATEPPHASYKKIFQQLERPHVLYLALLLHDVGKAANVDHHAEASLEMARKVAQRLRLGPDETALLQFLVRDHLKLSMLSQRRDLDDQATIDAAAHIVKDEVNLNALMLLTFADAAGTSIKTWTEWKEALLWELYRRTKQTLSGADRVRDILSRRIEQLYGEVSAALKDKLPLEEVYSHFELMPASYYINTGAAEITRHLMVIHRFLTRQLEVEEAADALVPVVDWQSFPAQGYSQVSICTWDRLGLFSKICGSFASAELNILRANIYTRSDHVVVDVFDVCDKNLDAVTDQRAIQTAEGMLERMLSDREKIEFTDVLQRLRAIRGPAPKIREVRIPTVISFDNDISKGRTIIEIQTEDRLGLLYTITHTLSDLGLDISFAKISTEKGAAIDTFYVQDQLGNKVTDPTRLSGIRAKLDSAINLLAT
ncbi:MAG TPA: [protein-PII] uridylyltransferase [Verrucomicrobiae bacterium]|nr:[protein-PII] uridylyltransferase [Verrucomicrobiae bacterium]